jgi:hypothetical protein
MLKPTRFVIYGTPSAEVKDAVAAFNPVYMTRLQALESIPFSNFLDRAQGSDLSPIL